MLAQVRIIRLQLRGAQPVQGELQLTGQLQQGGFSLFVLTAGQSSEGAEWQVVTDQGVQQQVAQLT
jgi:hypothetical protein